MYCKIHANNLKFQISNKHYKSRESPKRERFYILTGQLFYFLNEGTSHFYFARGTTNYVAGPESRYFWDLSHNRPLLSTGFRRSTSK